MITAPPPVRQTIDANGVELATGILIVATPQVTVGQGEGALSYTRFLVNNGWTDNLIGTIAVSGSTYTVSFGGGSENFTLSGGLFTNAQGGGSTLVSGGSGACSGASYTYTTATGAAVCFSTSLAGSIPSYATARPTSANYPDGLVVTYTYNSVSGPTTYRLQSVNNNFGYQLKLTYACDSLGTSCTTTQWTTIASVTGINNAVDYCSPTANSCSGFTMTWPKVTYSTSTTPPYPVTVTDSLSNQSFFTYNSSGELVAIQRPGASANTTSITYNGSGQVTSVTNSAKSVGPKGSGPGLWTYTYSVAGGNQTTISEDPMGDFRTVVASVATSLVSSDKDALSRTTSYIYDSFGRLTQVTQPETNYTVIAYDGRGNVTSTTAYPNSGSGNIVTYQANYDTTCSSPSYPAKCNQPNWTEDANGNKTTFAYTSASVGTGQITSVTGPPPTSGANPPQTRLSYTGLYAYYKQASGGSPIQGPSSIQLVTGTSRCATGVSPGPPNCVGTSDEVTTSLAYGAINVANNLGLTSATTASGASGGLSATTSTTWGPVGDVATVTGPTSETTAFFYDADRNRVGLIGPQPASGRNYPAFTFTYSPNGQLTSTEQGTTTSQSSLSTFTAIQQQTSMYDALGRLSQTSFVDVASGQTQSLTQYAYDNVNRLICTAVRMNTATFPSEPSSACLQGTAGSAGPDRITYNTYDAASELLKVTIGYLTAAQEDYVAVTYTANGLASTLTDANGNVTTDERDPYDRVCAVEFPGTSQATCTPTSGVWQGYGYDNNGNVTTFTQRTGDTVSYTYDALNRRLTKSFSAGSAQNIAYTYDLLNRPLSAQFTKTGGTSVVDVWDALSRVTSETSNGRALSYSYDLANNRTGVTWPDASPNNLAATYVYDALNRVTQIKSNSTAIANYVYDDLGRRTNLTPTNGAATTYGYDLANRINSLGQTFTSTGYDVTFSFTYNPADQALTRATTNDTDYTVDPNTTSVSYSPNGLNQYASINSSSNTYDTRGDLTLEGTSSKAWTYDLQNELLTANLPTAVTLTYDATGRLQTSTASSTTATFLYAGQMLVGEYNGSTIVGRYIPGPDPDEALLWYNGSTPEWLAADQMGSTVAYSNSAGNVGATYAYDPFGQPGGGWSGPRYHYTGEIEIPEAHLYDYKARAYFPQQGRFLQTDPTGYASDMNLYAYIANDPINGADPSGTGNQSNYVGLKAQCVSSCPVNVSELDVTAQTEHTAGFGAGTVNLSPSVGLQLAELDKSEGGRGDKVAPQTQQKGQACKPSSGPYNPRAVPTNLPPGWSTYTSPDGDTNEYMQDGQNQLALTPDAYANAVQNHDAMSHSMDELAAPTWGGTTVIGLLGRGAGAWFSALVNGTFALLTSGTASSPPPPPPGC